MGPREPEHERGAQPVVRFRPAPLRHSCPHASVRDVFLTHGEDLLRGTWPHATVEVEKGPRGRAERHWTEYLPFAVTINAEEP